MSIIFDSKDILLMSDKELFSIWKSLRKKIIIYMNLVTALTVFVFILGIITLFYEWNWLFLICAIYLLDLYFYYKNIPVKFRDRLLKTPAYRFEDEHFYVGEKQLSYSDIELFEMGGSFARIKMGRYKLVLIFKGRDKGEMDMLVEKLKANAKKYKELT